MNQIDFFTFNRRNGNAVKTYSGVNVPFDYDLFLSELQFKLKRIRRRHSDQRSNLKFLTLHSDEIKKMESPISNRCKLEGYYLWIQLRRELHNMIS